MKIGNYKKDQIYHCNRCYNGKERILWKTRTKKISNAKDVRYTNLRRISRISRMCGILTISGKKQIIDFWSIKFIRVREGLKKVNHFRGIFCKGGGRDIPIHENN